MTSDLKARLDAMVREKVKQRRVSGMAGKSHLLIYPLVALDLLQERDALKDKLDAAEAKVKALEDADAHALCARVAELEALLKELFSIGEVYISAIESKYATTDFEAWAAKVPSHLKEAPHEPSL